MSNKRALVVDDSKSARVAMKRMLKKYALKVEFAESGEEALLFLEHSTADVIFMDHNMPGMDGLEAVTAIKSNPRTATIPVLMYTTNNDDVYVSRARALGALAVLPKEVQPGVLFDSLLKLGLVEERREEPEKVPFAQLVGDEQAPSSKADDAFEQQALNVSIQTQITRTLEEQHLQLRSDIMNVKRDFAIRVSREIIDQQRTDQSLLDSVALVDDENNSFAPGARPLLYWAVPVFLLLAILIGISLSSLTGQDEIGETLDKLVQSVETNTSKINKLPLSTPTEIRFQDTTENSIVQAQNKRFIKTLEWALNKNNYHPYTEVAFNQETVQSLENLLTQLDELGFIGHIKMESHLGEFCLINNDDDGYQLAPGNLPLSKCDLIGHPKDDSVFISDQQSVDFNNFIDSSSVLSSGDIRLTSIANNGQSSSRRYPLPTDVSTAGEWNRIAGMNNRIVYSLIPD